MGYVAIVMLGIAWGDGPATIVARVPLGESGEVAVADLVAELARATGRPAPSTPADVRLPTGGVAGSLARSMLLAGLGEGATVDVRDGRLAITLDPAVVRPDRLADWDRRLADLADRAAREARRRSRYGMVARPSYAPDDPTRPTICLVHGINSSSGSFVHMVEPLEQAGYGVVAYDFPFNRGLGESSTAFARDWAEFRRRNHDSRKWAIVTHSMGALLARSYVEGESYAGDVSSLILIGPPNAGSNLAGGQTVLQLIEGMRAIRGGPRSDPLAKLGDGLGASAGDLAPGSAFLKALNGRPRRDGVPYHILAGDVGFLNAAARAQIEPRLKAMRRGGLASALLGNAAGDLTAALEEVADGTGDGSVSVASTRLAGVADRVVIHANHVELIRGPLLFPDPGPVVSMPHILRWPAADAPGGR